jgi:hypothetical protein
MISDMITDRDILRLKDIFVTKEEFNLKFDELKAIQDKILVFVDKILKKLDIMHSEYIALKVNDDRQNRQINQLADASGIKLEE